MRTLSEISAALAVGKTTSRQLVEDCLARIADPAGEGARAFIEVDAEGARAAADAMDALRRAGRAPGPLAGIPFSVKDLADIAGRADVGRLAGAAGVPPASANAPVVQRIVEAGLVVIGRTNMTEFAFSGLGINPHYGTPKAAWDRATGRIPGGSSSGAGVSVADGMACGALGTDTGGSCRIPAAMCGIVGFKPTARRVPIEGVLPLSHSLDSIGPLAHTVGLLRRRRCGVRRRAHCRTAACKLPGLRLAVPQTLVLDGMDDDSGHTPSRRRWAGSRPPGCAWSAMTLPVVDEIAPANARGSFAAAEAWAWHRDLIAAKSEGYDPQVLRRIVRGRDIGAADYVALPPPAPTSAHAPARQRRTTMWW